jgi:hypothetical protein
MSESLSSVLNSEALGHEALGIVNDIKYKDLLRRVITRPGLRHEVALKIPIVCRNVEMQKCRNAACDLVSLDWIARRHNSITEKQTKKEKQTRRKTKRRPVIGELT